MKVPPIFNFFIKLFQTLVALIILRKNLIYFLKLKKSVVNTTSVGWKVLARTTTLA